MSKKKNFTLRNIDNIEIIKKFSLTEKCINNYNYDNNDDKDITFINELSINNDKKTYSFMDDSKQLHSCIVTMIQNKKTIEKCDNTKCFWCRNTFNTEPIGCPIKFIAPEIVKKHYSYINNENYIIREKTYKETDKTTYYETDGIFCSFNCCLAYINHNKRNYIYKDSLMLLSKMYYDLFNTKFNIIQAPSWRMLSEFGGNMSIEEFRKSFNKIEYLDIGQHITNMPVQYSIGHIYEEKIKF